MNDGEEWIDSQDYEELYDPSINNGSEDWIDHELGIDRCPYCGAEMYDSDGDWVCPNLCESWDDV